MQKKKNNYLLDLEKISQQLWQRIGAAGKHHDQIIIKNVPDNLFARIMK